MEHSTAERAMGLNIKNAEVHELARALAQRTGTSMTEAIRLALQEKLQRLTASQDREAVLARVDDIVRRSGPTAPGVSSDHAHLYDEIGLPQ
jgi:antitoxin VapB